MKNKKITHFRTILSLVLFVSISFGIVSCADDNSTTGAETGGKITVGVSSNLFNGGGNDDASLTKSEKLSSYTTVASNTEFLSGGLMLESSLQQENQSSTKSTLSFATGTKIRVLACKAGTTSVESYGDFTVVDASADPEPSAGYTLQVTEGVPYDFYFITYNCTDSVPYYTTIPFKDIQLGNIDFLMAKLANRTLSSTDNIINDGAHPVTLDQMLTRVRLVLDASDDKIAIKSTAAELVANVFFNYSYKYVTINADGSLTGGKDSIDTKFTWKVNADTLTGSTKNGMAYTDISRTVYVPAAGYITRPENGEKTNFHIHINTLACADTTWTGLNSYFNYTLAQGTRYRLVATLHRMAFSGSNIYWDAATSKLTFDPVGATTSGHEYQGVLFKWGSLVGIAPNQDFSTSSKVYTTNGSSWTQQTASAAGYSDYSAIPTSTAVGTGSEDIDRAKTVLSYSASDHATGDICAAIAAMGGAPASSSDVSGVTYTWRMATSKEMFVGSNSDWNETYTQGWSKVGAFSDITSSTTDATGKAVLAVGAKKSLWNGVFFPASGDLWTDGVIGDVGVYGGYWTGSAASSGNAYLFEFDNTGYKTTASSNRSMALPVRCVRVIKK